MARLTKLEREAVLAVIDERLAGGASDLADALGMSKADVEKLMQRLESAATKLTPSRRS